MEEQKNDTQQVCPQCGGPVVQADVLAGSGPLVLAKPRSAFSLGIARGSAVSARVCSVCGYVEFYATNPEVLK